MFTPIISKEKVWQEYSGDNTVLFHKIYDEEAKTASRITKMRFSIEAKLESAKARRERFRHVKERRANFFNDRCLNIMNKYRKKKMTEENYRQTESNKFRKVNQEQIMLKKVNKLHVACFFAFLLNLNN